MAFRLAIVVTIVVVFVPMSIGTDFDEETGDLAGMIAQLTADDLGQSNDEPSVKRNSRDTGSLELKNDGVKWRNELLSNISSLRLYYPGEVFVFGSQAEPIFAEPGQCFIAAGEYGKGRVVVVTVFMSLLGTTSNPNEKQFYSNVKTWVTKGQYRTDNDFITLDKLVSGPTSFSAGAKKGLFSDGSATNVSSKDVLDFIRQGGGFVYTVTPWWWLYKNPEKMQTDMPFAEVLHTTGFCLGTGINWPKNSQYEYAVTDNRAADVHVVRALMSAVNGYLNDNLIEPVYALDQISQYVDPNLVKPHVQSSFDKLNGIVTSASFPSPSLKTPVTDASVLRTFDLWLSVYKFCAEEGLKAPGCDVFPGDFAKPPVTVTSDIITITSISLQSAAYATGYYLPAGHWMTIELLPTNKDECIGWSVDIGNNNDDLRGSESLSRWPLLDRTLLLYKPVTRVISPFGGTVRFWSPDGKISTCRARLQNVVPTPFFKLGDDIQKWNNEVRNYPGLWADLWGNYFHITLPSSSIRNVDPTAALKFWDKIVSSYHDLRGTDVNKERAFWFITDVQLIVGSLHNGYPIVSEMDYANFSNPYFILGPAIIQNGDWGVFHEFGHNMQRSAWTFDGMAEVTTNIFTLYAFDTFYGVKPFTNPWLHDGIKGVKRYLNSTGSWPSNDYGIDLNIYAQIARDFGWDCFKKFFRRYEAMSDSELPTTTEDQIDLVFITFSQVSGYNLRPLTKFWNIPISDTASAKMAQLPISFLPDDELTRSAVNRTVKVLAEFPNAKRSLP